VRSPGGRLIPDLLGQACEGAALPIVQRNPFAELGSKNPILGFEVGDLVKELLLDFAGDDSQHLLPGHDTSDL
jgi:hypothetical protein